MKNDSKTIENGNSGNGTSGKKVERGFISREDLVTILDRRSSGDHDGEEVLLAEVLGEVYFRAGHIPGAINMPLDRVVAIAKANTSSKVHPIVLYCASEECQNSHVAARTLRQLGYSNVRVFAGGKADWKAAGLPLVVPSRGAAA